MERQRTLTLPERPQRGYWQFLYKYPSKYPWREGTEPGLELKGECYYILSCSSSNLIIEARLFLASPPPSLA
jgi:hypothetical protein